MSRCVCTRFLSHRRKNDDHALDAEVPELDADVGTGTEGDVEARCFSETPNTQYRQRLTAFSERDSPRDQLIVTFFLLVVIGLLLYAAIRSRQVILQVSNSNSADGRRLRKAIEARGRPTDLREWSEVSLTPPTSVRLRSFQ